MLVADLSLHFRPKVCDGDVQSSTLSLFVVLRLVVVKIQLRFKRELDSDYQTRKFKAYVHTFKKSGRHSLAAS